MSERSKENIKFLNDIYIKKPIYLSKLQRWKVLYVDNGKWVYRIFFTKQEALFFYYKKLRLYNYSKLNDLSKNCR